MLKYTRSAIGLLTRQYRSVLRKCWEINVGIFALGAAAVMTPSEAMAVTEADDIIGLQEAFSDFVEDGYWTGSGYSGASHYWTYGHDMAASVRNMLYNESTYTTSDIYGGGSKLIRAGALYYYTHENNFSDLDSSKIYNGSAFLVNGDAVYDYLASYSPSVSWSDVDDKPTWLNDISGSTGHININSANGQIHINDFQVDNSFELDGKTVSGISTSVSSSSTNDNLVTAKGVYDYVSGEGYAKLAGGTDASPQTFTGVNRFTNGIVVGSGLATPIYMDNGSINIGTTHLSGGASGTYVQVGNSYLSSSNFKINNSMYADGITATPSSGSNNLITAGGVYSYLNDATNGYVKKSGDTMSGPLSIVSSSALDAKLHLGLLGDSSAYADLQVDKLTLKTSAGSATVDMYTGFSQSSMAGAVELSVTNGLKVNSSGFATGIDFADTAANRQDAAHLATNGWVKAQIGNGLISIQKNGSTVDSFNLNDAGDAVINIDDVASASDLTTNYYTKTDADDRYVNVTGDTMTGALTVNNNNRSVSLGGSQAFTASSGSETATLDFTTTGAYLSLSNETGGTGTFIHGRGIGVNGSSEANGIDFSGDTGTNTHLATVGWVKNQNDLTNYYTKDESDMKTLKFAHTTADMTLSENGLSKGLSLFVMSENRASNDVAGIHGPFGLTISANDNVPRVRTRHRGLTKIEINKSCLACGSKRQGIFKLKEIQRCAKVRHLDEVTHSALRGMTISVANDNIADLLQQVANTEQLTTTFLRAI